MQAARWGSPPTKAGRRSRSGSLTRAGRPRTGRSQCHQCPADGQRGDTGGGRLPPMAGWALRQP
jgi:hypothetical protein